MFFNEEWEYLNEGNANVVVHYTGKNKDLHGKILRIQKLGHRQNLAFLLQYQHLLVTSLFGAEFYSKAEIVRLEPEFLKVLSSNIQDKRDQKRASNDIDLSNFEAILMDNLTFSNNQHGCAFEMKPKWGFFPTEYTQSCRFCLHNAVKSKEGEEKSEFCPMELFSGDSTLMLNSFKALSKTPKNNLRLFKAGSIIPIDELAAPDLDLYMKILSSLLAHSSVLRSLKKHQQSFHDDILQLKPFEHLGKTIDSKEYMMKVLSDDWEDHENNVERRISRLLLSLSIKDLSLFITILPRDISPETSFDLNHFIGKSFLIKWNNGAEGVIMFDSESVFDFKIKVVDVDIKKIEKMDKWFNLEKELSSFQEQHSNLKVCNKY